MASFNHVVLMGNITRDVELKYLQSGQGVATLGLAVNEKWKTNGETKESVLFIDCTCWGKTAEIAGEYCHKGSPVMVSGRVKLEQWTTREGEKRSKIGVTVDRLVLCGSKRDDEQQPNAAPAEQQYSAPAPAAAVPATIPEDDIPW